MMKLPHRTSRVNDEECYVSSWLSTQDRAYLACSGTEDTEGRHMATTSNRQRSQLWQVKPIDLILKQSDEPEHGLKRTLGPWSITLLGIGAIVGTGIFVLTGVAAAKYAGPVV